MLSMCIFCDINIPQLISYAPTDKAVPVSCDTKVLTTKTHLQYFLVSPQIHTHTHHDYILHVYSIKGQSIYSQTFYIHNNIV